MPSNALFRRVFPPIFTRCPSRIISRIPPLLPIWAPLNRNGVRRGRRQKILRRPSVIAQLGLLYPSMSQCRNRRFYALRLRDSQNQPSHRRVLSPWPPRPPHLADNPPTPALQEQIDDAASREVDRRLSRLGRPPMLTPNLTYRYGPSPAFISRPSLRIPASSTRDQLAAQDPVIETNEVSPGRN